MTLINSSLLLGLVLATVPVILHMVMRAKPKRIEFPALRLLKARRTSNSRRMQLRHFLLLLLRALVIAVLVLAIARPSLPAARYGLRWWEWTILAVVVAGGYAAYKFLTRRKQLHLTNSFDAIERRGRLRLWCTLAGLLAALIGVGVPWGMRVRAELLSPRSEAAEDIPVAAVFLVDTSISMNYRFENQTRLEHAVTVATEHIGRFPASSRVAVAGLNADEDIVFQADMSGAASRLETLEVTSVPESINRRIKAAIQTQIDDRKRVQEETNTGGSADAFAREIYVMTDFTKFAWQEPDESGLADALKEADWLQVYLVDVAVQTPQNLSITNLQLSEETTVAGRDLLMTMSVNRTGNAAMMTTMETIVLDPTGAATRQGAPQIVKLESGAAQITTAVKVTGTEPFLEGFVRLTSEDPLADDNVRYFSCGVRPRPKVLLVSDLAGETDYLRNALQPEGLEKIGVRFCDCVSVVTANIGQQTLGQYDVVFLVNCQRPDETLWSSLTRFVESGGGLFVVAGSDRLQSSVWNSTAAKELLPGALIPAGSRGAVKFLREPAQLQLESSSHPLLKSFANDEAARVELSAVAFDKCWATEPFSDSKLLLSFSGPGNRAAMLERKVGRGTVLMFTSAMDNLLQGGNTWNNLPNSWSFLMLTDQILQYLSGASNVDRNFLAGQAVDMPIPVTQRFEQYLLQRPQLRQTRGKLPAEDASLLITDAVDAGHYRVKPQESPSRWQGAFAMNFRDEETNLTRIQDDAIQKLVGTDRVAFIHNPAELQRAVRVGRLGIELFPVLMGLIVILICAEHLMANYFYDEVPDREASRAA